MAYPTTTDVSDYLATRGVSFSGDVSRYLNAAIAELERLTGYTPFLAEATASTAYYDTETRVLDLRGGYVDISSVERVDLETLDVVETLVERVDYDRIPGTERADLLWLYGSGKGRRKYKVVGRRGYSDNVPADVFVAIIQRAASLIGAATGGSYEAVKEGDVSISYGSGDGGAWGSELRNFAHVVERYRRVSYGGETLSLGC